MPINLDRLPFDILFNIAGNLEFEDVISLCHTCQQLNLLLAESSLCWKIVRDHAPHSKEAHLAQDGHITYGDAVKSIYSRRHAFSRALPFSARPLGTGNDFTYRQGVLCILNGRNIQVSDIHNSKEPINLDIFSIVKTHGQTPSAESQMSLLYYSDNLLAIHYERKGRNNGRIWLVNTEPSIPEEARLKWSTTLTSSHKLFARHTSSFLYYGTYTGMSDNTGRHEWEIRGANLPPGVNVDSPTLKPLQLEEFFGTDIGSTVAFEIHDDFFYAISNQTTFDVEEIDWTSYYHVIRFPIATPVKDAMQIKNNVYRRQHREGPIHDSWTDLSIQIDEKSNKPMIVEARREWQNGSSRQLRTFYMSEIDFDSNLLGSDDQGNRNNGNEQPNLPEDDIYVHLLESHDRPNYMKEVPREAWQVHPEFGQGCTNTRTFILSRTKFRGYNYSANAFVDLVEDDKCCSTSNTPCVRLRVGARQLAPFMKLTGPAEPIRSLKGKEKEIERDDKDLKHGTRYRHSEIVMWPPSSSSTTCTCTTRLHHILNPVFEGGSSARTITGAMDDRSLVYMVKSGRSYGYGGDDGDSVGNLVLVSFDRDIKASATSTPGSSKDAEDMDVEEDVDKGKSAIPSEWRWEPGLHRRCQQQTCA
ncbi:hypothetical protein B0J11DRAFT_577104 [Dendryphion nanum]|uniref:F-box domain-containing protein n=1 Tax=Dendryphion nanum TaxID=256645 RepID=A0A9P9ISY6_9PLEO|nr:hypothetical protein B0J11DRAFT_577104 [Dendryphion nanum]